MPPKRARVSSSEATPSKSKNPNPHKFVSVEAAERYKHSVVHKSVIPERGFEGNITHIIQHAGQRGWEELVKQPKSALVPVVREFYANAKEHKDKRAFVRGKWVPFDRTTINKHYNLPDIEGDKYSRYREQPNTAEVLKFLTNGRVQWKMKGDDVLHFPSSGLAYETKAWHYFISATLLPSGNTYEVTKERAILNYAILKGFSIDVGKIIERSIMDRLKGGTTGGLGHPSLIYALCVAAGVPTTANEEIVHPQAAITRKKMEQYKSTREAHTDTVPPVVHEGSPSSSAPDTHTLTEGMSQMQLFVREELQWRHTVDRRLDQILHRQDQLAARQDVQFQYLAQFTTTLGDMFSNCAINTGPNAVSFPHPPSLPPLAPIDPHQHTTIPEEQQPDQPNDT